MKTLSKNSIQRNIIIYIGALSLLIIPFVGMQVSTEVNWTFTDFLVGGILLMVAATSVNLILNFIHIKTLKIVLLILSFIFIVLIWAELAVGIFGSPFTGS